MRRNPARVIEILVWPSFEALLFGLLASGGTSLEPEGRAITLTILTGIVYWNCTARVIQESVAQFIDDFISKNIQNLLITPVTLFELLIAVTAASLTKMALSIGALLFVLAFVFSGFFSTLGPHALLWVFQLELFGVALSLFALSAVLLFGERASFSGWILSTIIQIFSLAFYDRSALPQPLFILSYFIPSSYIFESIRQYTPTNALLDVNQAIALALSGVYLLTGVFVARSAYGIARRTGTLTKL